MPIDINNKNSDDDDDGLCIMCCTNTINTVVLPCAHFVVCSECSDKMNKDDKLSKNCIICRGKIEKIFYLDSNKVVDFCPNKRIYGDVDRNMCRMCEEHEAETIVDPCGCIILCEDCSYKVSRLKDNDKCLECGVGIERITYFKSGKEIFL